jgi:hypothetical protein
MSARPALVDPANAHFTLRGVFDAWTPREWSQQTDGQGWPQVAIP